ncbi:potassium voltage-gated channel subfamily KQT member 1-like isoform X2 [Actinia tenebrosa]|uniref:Potassium voltage-gated channel subfamily KQT member 1-like isoform X2 n=1 Tax=Actinia tenebrosa TaxID=6105 RepID=A0A6P8J4J3_ACTTE|nr:potassium voltage-gated channel subfamily KQT member 1-like isoform X2 [Actinia tenebrosa]
MSVMFRKGSTNFARESGDCDLSLKEARFQSYTLKSEEKASKGDECGSVVQNGPSTRLDLLGRPIPGARNRAHSEQYRKIQLACYNFLERPHGLSHLYHASICLLVVMSLFLTALSTVNTDDMDYWTILRTPVFVVEVILVLVFITEYVVRLWAAGCRSTYVGFKGRLKFAKKTYAILDILVIISSISALTLVATAKVPTTAVSLIRFLPLLRVLRFDRQGGTWKLLASVIYIHRKELVTTLYLGFISLIFASFVLYMVEKDANIKFDSWPNSFWWGIVTLTTIGYGDKTPITWYGRFCAALFAVFGISFFALPAGILGSGFALKVTQQQRQKHFHRRRRPAAILLQSHWRMYCADINSKSVATWLPHIYYNRRTSHEKTPYNNTVDSSQLPGSGAPKKGRKLSSVWKSRNEGKATRSQSVDVIRASRSDSAPMIDTGVTGQRQGSIGSTLDTSFFDEANISLSEDGETAITLTPAQKHAIRLIRLLKLNVAIRKFKEARKPYDVKDVIEQYSTGHVEMLSRMKSLQQRIDKVVLDRENALQDESSFRSSITCRLIKVEQQVTSVERKIDAILNILSKTTGADTTLYHHDEPGPSPPPDGHSPGSSTSRSSGLPTVIIGSDKMFDTSRLRSESLPSTAVAPEDISHWPPKHSQSDPVLPLNSIESMKPHRPRTPSLSSEDSTEGGQNMDCLNAPTVSSVAPNRILGNHGRQLSDVTEGDESVSSDSKENVLGSKFSRESTLDSIEDTNEPMSPSDDVDFPMYDPLLNPYAQDKSPKTTEEQPLVWEKKPHPDTKRTRSESHKTSSTSSFGTLVGEGSGNGSMEQDCCYSDVFQGSQEESSIDKEMPGASLVGESFDLDESVTSVDESKSKRRPLLRHSPIEV